jgi:hypothetical protein
VFETLILWGLVGKPPVVLWQAKLTDELVSVDDGLATELPTLSTMSVTNDGVSDISLNDAIWPLQLLLEELVAVVEKLPVLPTILSALPNVTRWLPGPLVTAKSLRSVKELAQLLFKVA